MPHLKPKDIVAILIIGGMLVLEISGHDGPLAPAVALIVGYYFGHRDSGGESKPLP